MAKREAIRVRIKGLRKASRQIRRYGREAERAAVQGLVLEGEAIMAASVPLVPKDTGTLAGTGHVSPPLPTAAGTRLVLSYGGPAAPYAARQHEDLALRHAPGQQAKYLEQPALERIPGMPERLAERVRRAIGRG